MDTFTSILVDVDAAASAQPAVERAALIARRCGAPLRIVDVLSIRADATRRLGADLQDELMMRRRQQLARIAYSVRDIHVDADVLWGTPAEALIDDVQRFGHDLVVRAHTRDLVARGPKPLVAVDVELFRRCPCPVWAVGPGAAPRRPSIVCAVDALADDPAKGALNVKIVNLGLLLMRLQEASLTVLCAWRPVGEEHVYSHGTDDAFAAHLGNSRHHAKHRLARFSASFGDRLTGIGLELRRGSIEDVLADYVVAEGIDLVVMGTAQRAGFTRRLRGTKAERVLQRVPCSVLAVKPDAIAPAVRVRDAV